MVQHIALLNWQWWKTMKYIPGIEDMMKREIKLVSLLYFQQIIWKMSLFWGMMYWKLLLIVFFFLLCNKQSQVWGAKGGPYEFKPAPASSFSDMSSPLNFPSTSLEKRIEDSYVLPEWRICKIQHEKEKKKVFYCSENIFICHISCSIFFGNSGI